MTPVTARKQMPIGPQRQYVPLPGTHISKADAAGIGLSLEQFIQVSGRIPSVSEFADKAKNKADPAHDAVSRRHADLTKIAWHEAARYCLDSTAYILLPIEGEGGSPSKPIKAFVLSPICTAHAQDHDVYPLDTARAKASVRAQQNMAFMSRLESLMSNHALLVGRSAMKQAVRRVLAKF